MRGKGRAGRRGGGRSEEEEKNGGWGIKQEIGRREKMMSMTARRNKERERERGEREGGRKRERG